MAQLLGPAAHSPIWSLSFLNCLHCLPLQRCIACLYNVCQLSYQLLQHTRASLLITDMAHCYSHNNTIHNRIDVPKERLAFASPSFRILLQTTLIRLTTFNRSAE